MDLTFLGNLAIAITSNINTYFLLVLVATALWGDFGLLTLTAVAVNYHISLWIVFIAAYIGTMIGDSIWYLIGTGIAGKIEKHKHFRKGYERVAYIIDKIFKKNHLLALITVKYLYGTRVIMIFYLAKEKLSYLKFLYYDFISTIFWIVGVGLVGYLIGLGFLWARTVFANIQLALAVFIIGLVIFHFIQKEIYVKVEKKIDKVKNKK